MDGAGHQVPAPRPPHRPGGITASFYAKHLMETFPIDYLVHGDAEESFPILVAHLMDGRTPPPLPNVWSPSGPPPSLRSVPPSVYDASAPFTLDWFPTLAEETRQAHADYAEAPFWGAMDRFHPYLPLNRGCRFPCNGCFASDQRDVFGPGQVDRGAASFERLLDQAAADPHVNFVNLTAGTEDMARLASYRGVLSKRRPLGAYVMHFCALPTEQDLDLLLGAFDRVCIDFTDPTSVPLPLRAQGLDTAAAEDRIFQLCEALDSEPRVRVGVSFLHTSPTPFKSRLQAVDWERVELKENSEWSLPRPNIATLGLPTHLRGQEVDMPALPVPMVERRGLSAEARAARDHAKAEQAQALMAVSRGHARYELACALCPGLGAFLWQAVRETVDGTLHDAPVQPVIADSAFLDAYRDRFRTWHVHTLPRLDLRLIAWSSMTEQVDAGEVSVSPDVQGQRVTWSGRIPEGTVGLSILPRLGWTDGRFVEPDLPCPRVALPADTPGDGVLRGLVSSASVELDLEDATGTRLAQACWSRADTAHPSAPAVEPGEPAVEEEPEDTAPPEPKLPRHAPANCIALPWAVAGFAERLVRILSRTFAHPAFAGWTTTPTETDPRFVSFSLHHRTDTALRIWLLPPGSGRVAWTGHHLRLVVQSDDGDLPPEARDFVGKLEKLLPKVEHILTKRSARTQ